MAVTTVRNPTEFEDRLAQYLFERSEEGRAVRVGEKETSEQAEIVRRYADLFSREQLELLGDAERQAAGDERELLYRLRKTCESGLVSAALVERQDELENRLLAARISFEGEELPLRTAQALQVGMQPGTPPRQITCSINGHGILTVPSRHSNHAKQFDGQLSSTASDTGPHGSCIASRSLALDHGSVYRHHFDG